MQTQQGPILVAVDVGAGLGAKIGLFRDTNLPFAESLLSVEEYGSGFDSFADSLIRRIGELLETSRVALSEVRAIGVACPGILNGDGSFRLVQNLPTWSGRNLRELLSASFRIPVGIENDANAGGLAEWSVLRLEILYWVFGGGWGGCWISRDGRVRFPALDWDGRDESLHYTNEPGYAIPLDKLMLKPLFTEVGASFERFEKIVTEELAPGGRLVGPCGNPDTLRAEVIISGPGRVRLFRTLAGDDDFYERFLDDGEGKSLSDPTVAGRLISKLSSMRVEAAVNTDRLYGKVLGMATRILLKAARSDGMPENLPICLGGKPSYALPYFGPSAQRAMGRLGILNYLRPSVIDERGSNANLVGAAVLAHETWQAVR